MGMLLHEELAHVEAATYSAFGVSLDITPSDSDSEEDDEKKEAEEEDKE